MTANDDVLQRLLERRSAVKKHIEHLHKGIAEALRELTEIEGEINNLLNPRTRI